MVVQKHQTPGKLESGLLLSFSQFPIQESVSQEWPSFCGTGGHPSFGSLFGQVFEGRQIPLPGESLTILLGQNQGFVFGQGCFSPWKLVYLTITGHTLFDY